MNRRESIVEPTGKINSYAVYERKTLHNYLGSFRIVDDLVDGTEEPDGPDIFSFALNVGFQTWVGGYSGWLQLR